MEAEIKERKYITEFREKLIKAGVDLATRIDLQEWLAEALYNQYVKGSEEASKIYRDALLK